MRTYYPISLSEMDTFLRHRGFTPITLPKVKEHVYSHLITKDTCIRVYTGIVDQHSRDRGADAIRITLVKRLSDGTIIPIAKQSPRVYRLANWKRNLTIALDNAIDNYYAIARVRQKTAI